MDEIVVAAKSDYANKLRIAMAAAKLNQSRLAAQVNVSKRTIASYCSNRTLPDIQIASKIANATGQPLEYFRTE